MELAEFKRDVWGREVLLGVSWDWLWVIIVLSLVFVAVHALVMAVRRKPKRPSKDGPRVQRHAAIDRAFHWIMAVSIFVLLVTGVLPIVGVAFDWLTIHWIAGLVLTVVVLFHLVRSLFWQDIKTMWINARDFKEPFDANVKPGKYSFAQKGMHAAVTVLSLLVIGSGLAMFAMIDTPWWDRTNAMSEATLGWVFFIHGLSTLLLIGVICLHVYFGLRPEKQFYLRSMVSGWVSRDELETHHDSSRWSPDKTS